MVRCTVERRIEAPVEQVFDLFADFRQVPGRIKAIKRLEVLTDGPIGAGTRFRETREMFGREATETMEITAFDRPHSYTVSCESCGSRFTSAFRFQPDGDGTRMTINFEAQAISLFAWLMSPMSWMMLGAVRKCVEQDVEDLKSLLEDENKPAPQPTGLA